MKIKKGKVYPSPSSSSSSSPPGDGDVVFSVLKLLPATILTLASVLSLEDKEVLAYMITRSLKTTTNPQNPISSSSPHQDSKKKSVKKTPNPKHTSINHSTPNSNLKVPIFTTNSSHKVPIFDCDCFNCYTSYWYRWDSSANRELIHQAIEAFEDHLTNGEQSKNKQRGNKRRENKSGRRVVDKPVAGVLLGQPEMEEIEISVLSPEIDAGDGVLMFSAEEKVGGGDGEEKQQEMVSSEVVRSPAAAVETEDVAAVVRSPAAAGVNNHKGLARKVLPDVLGILNSRLWSLWGPNV